MTKSGSGHVIGVPVVCKAYGIEEGCRDTSSSRKDDRDHLAVSLTHPSPYASFGYKNSKYSVVIHFCSSTTTCCMRFFLTVY
jgi:hypothetical protein